MTKYERIVPVDDLPPSLWSRAKLRIAPELAAAYRMRVTSVGLSKLAAERGTADSPVGGLTKEAADRHFAQAFDGSVARTELALLDPKSEVTHVADTLAQMCSGGRLAILDLPSGAGALSLSLLCTLAELRATGTIPRHPLEVVVVGGEINQYATAHANALFATLVPTLAKQAVHVEFRPILWDVCDADSTAEVLKRFVADADRVDQKLVAVSNFTGFLGRSGKKKQAQPQLENVFRLSSGPNATCIWLEPQTNAAIREGGVLPWLVRLVQERLHRLARLVGVRGHLDDLEPSYATTEVPFDPLSPKSTATVRLAVVRFDLSPSAS